MASRLSSVAFCALLAASQVDAQTEFRELFFTRHGTSEWNELGQGVVGKLTAQMFDAPLTVPTKNADGSIAHQGGIEDALNA